MSDTSVTLGQLIDGDQEKDAIHIAIAPVIACEKLFPGQDIGFMPDGRVGAKAAKLIGIVDPYLKQMVLPDQKFWMCLYLKTITSLRHDWTHPDFVSVAPVVAAKVDKSAAETWFKELSDSAGNPYSGATEFSVEELIEAGHEFLRSGDRLVQQGADNLRGSTKPEEYWEHFETITGVKVPSNERYSTPFCCTC